MIDNSKVKFRRGGSDLPTEKNDGDILLNTENGKMYVDTKTIDNNHEVLVRRAVSGYLFGVSDTGSGITSKSVEIPGVPAYFNGLTVTVIFENIDKTLVGDNDNLKLSICDTCLGIQLPDTPLMVDSNTKLFGYDIEAGAPYQFVWQDGRFMIVLGNIGARPKWKHISDRN